MSDKEEEVRDFEPYEGEGEFKEEEEEGTSGQGQEKGKRMGWGFRWDTGVGGEVEAIAG